MAQPYVYRFYAELKGYKLKVWRRFEINGDRKSKILIGRAYNEN